MPVACTSVIVHKSNLLSYLVSVHIDFLTESPVLMHKTRVPVQWGKKQKRGGGLWLAGLLVSHSAATQFELTVLIIAKATSFPFSAPNDFLFLYAGTF